MVNYRGKCDCVKVSSPLMRLAKSFMKIVQKSLVKSVDNAQIKKEEYGSAKGIYQKIF
jgi:hypothetical protein